MTNSPALQEGRALLGLLAPILLSQLSQAAFGFVDTVMAGQVSPLDLAAVSLGASIWLPVVLLVSGILMATTPLVSAALGANRADSIPDTVHQALWLSLLLSVIGIVALLNVSPIFDWLETPAHLQSLTYGYLNAIAIGLPAAAIFAVLRNYCESMGHPMPVTIISVLGLLINIPVNYVFIHGKLGIPAMGGVGCGWASALVMWLMTLMLIGYVLMAPVLAKVRLMHQRSRPEWARMREFLKLGMPIGIAIFFEVSVFCVVAILISPLGELQVAGHQIALSVTSILFMFPLSLAFCMTIRVGHAYGAKDLNAILLTRKVGLSLTTGFAFLSAGFIVLARHQLTALYTNDLAVQALAANLLLFAAAYQVVDALQVGAAGSLRGLQDTRGPMVLTMVAYWVVAMPLGYVMGLTLVMGTRYGPHGFWTGLVVGLAVASVLLNWRLGRQIAGLQEKGFPH
ncbi:MAG: MATE family efflux transporter [Moraxellaceae bacterium]|jgi:MATE family multidrug resistance protein|nr:MATE family efflux transporter [Moraxellaceae bacterium]HQV40869.1 MATE family efflux transporter [Moraxellaceae bacterium]